MAHIGLLWLALTVGMIVAAEAGYRLHALLPASRRNAEASVMIMSATLAFMSLLAAFTFNIANSRYDLRRGLAVSEANAISTVFLRQQGLGAPEQARLAPLMQDYVTTRRVAVADEATDPMIAAAQQRSAALQAQIWSITLQSVHTREGAQIAFPLLTATNDMFNVAEARRAAIEAHIPPRELRVLVLLALGTSVMMGVALAARGSRHFVESTLMFALFALAMSLIHDLDTTNSGGIHTPSAALDRVVQKVVGGPEAGIRPLPAQPSHSQAVNPRRPP
jgi:hypothetical protein